MTCLSTATMPRSRLCGARSKTCRATTRSQGCAAISTGVGSFFGDLKASSDSGHFLLALDIAAWMPPDRFYERIEAMEEMVRSSGDEGEVRLPGDLRWRAYEEASALGIGLADGTREALSELGRALGLVQPWD